ncbi:hypothetical protein MRX96_041860 [Rhipicephalus microplus]
MATEWKETHRQHFTEVKRRTGNQWYVRHSSSTGGGKVAPDNGLRQGRRPSDQCTAVGLASGCSFFLSDPRAVFSVAAGDVGHSPGVSPFNGPRSGHLSGGSRCRRPRLSHSRPHSFISSCETEAAVR